MDNRDLYEIVGRSIIEDGRIPTAEHMLREMLARRTVGDVDALRARLAAGEVFTPDALAGHDSRMAQRHDNRTG